MKDHTQKKPEDSFDRSDLVGLFKRADEDLRNSIYAIINSFEILPDADIRADREVLQTTGLIAARRIEYAHQKLSTLARIVTKDFSPELDNRSIHSLTREAILFAIAQDGRFGEIGYDPYLSVPDVIARVDGDCVIHLLASLLLSISARSVDGTVRVSVSHQLGEGTVEPTWLITLEDSDTSIDWRGLLASPTLPVRSADEMAIYDKHWYALAQAIGITVELSEVPKGLLVRFTAPIIRQIQSPTTVPASPWSQCPAVLMQEEPRGFIPLRTERVLTSSHQDIDSIIEDTNAGLFVVHQPADDDEATRRNLELCQQVDIPILLRASHLTYEQLRRYRGHVDAILMEPCDEAVLAQYVSGLSKLERRSRRRALEIH